MWTSMRDAIANLTRIRTASERKPTEYPAYHWHITGLNKLPTAPTWMAADGDLIIHSPAFEQPEYDGDGNPYLTSAQQRTDAVQFMTGNYAKVLETACSNPKCIGAKATENYVRISE